MPFAFKFSVNIVLVTSQAQFSWRSRENYGTFPANLSYKSQCSTIIRGYDLWRRLFGAKSITARCRACDNLNTDVRNAWKKAESVRSPRCYGRKNTALPITEKPSGSNHMSRVCFIAVVRFLGWHVSQRFQNSSIKLGKSMHLQSDVKRLANENTVMRWNRRYQTKI